MWFARPRVKERRLRNEGGEAKEQVRRREVGVWPGGWGWIGGLKPQDEEAVLTREVVEFISSGRGCVVWIVELDVFWTCRG